MSPNEEGQRHDEAIRAVRDAETLTRLRSEHATFFAVIAAASDVESAAEAIAARFSNSKEAAEHVLRQRVTAMLPHRPSST